MAASPPTDDGSLVDQFLTQRGHEAPERWDRDAMKKQCPECCGLHELTASECAVCGWTPTG